jgi:hypothetical protein
MGVAKGHWNMCQQPEDQQHAKYGQDAVAHLFMA